MIRVYLGTDRKKVRATMNAAIQKASKKTDVIRITDAHTIEDMNAALRGGGMFAGRRVLVFEGVCAHPDLCTSFLGALERLSTSDDDVFIFEEKPLADVRKKLEKYAESIEKYDLPTGRNTRQGDIFAVANALRAGDKKALWVSYMREIGKGTAPEAVHGVLFWAAKDTLLKSNGDARERQRIAQLAELPHEARRNGEDLEYALERFALSIR